MISPRGVVAVALGLLALPAVPGAVRAQFEEPDTVPRFAVGPLLELTFRGTRGPVSPNAEMELTNGPAIGLRAEYRLTRTGAVAVTGTYARAEEQLNSAGATTTLGHSMALYQLAGEVAFRLKESVPGFFALGGGVRFVDADDDTAEDGFTRPEMFTEAMLTAGLGLEFALTRRDALRASGRYYMGIAGEHDEPDGALDEQTILNDFALGFAYLRRF